MSLRQSRASKDGGGDGDALLGGLVECGMSPGIERSWYVPEALIELGDRNGKANPGALLVPFRTWVVHESWRPVRIKA